MSTIARKISATPKRTAIEVWQVICDIVTDPSTNARKVFESVTGLACSIIVDEVLAENPIVITGKGPRLRIYCLYGEEALADENSSEDSLLEKPTIDNWHMYFPCNKEDLSWISASLQSVSSYITAYDKDKGIDLNETDTVTEKFFIDTKSLFSKV